MLPCQALVEQCAAAGKAAAVERCVLRLDLASLDFNQVRRLIAQINWIWGLGCALLATPFSLSLRSDTLFPNLDLLLMT